MSFGDDSEIQLLGWRRRLWGCSQKPDLALLICFATRGRENAKPTQSKIRPLFPLLNSGEAKRQHQIMMANG
jgi:hypothetical protein